MVARETFNGQLKDLMEDVLEICDHAITSYELSYRALSERNERLAHCIIEQDQVINRLEEGINDAAILIITKQQPVATDLRRLIVQMKVAADVERIGDYAANIAKEILRLQNVPNATNELLEHMFLQSIQMLKLIIAAYGKEDVVEVRELASLDDEIDALYKTVTQQLEQLSSTKATLHLSFIAHYIERVADHATNIAEHLLFLKKGKHYDLND